MRKNEYRMAVKFWAGAVSLVGLWVWVLGGVVSAFEQAVW